MISFRCELPPVSLRQFNKQDYLKKMAYHYELLCWMNVTLGEDQRKTSWDLVQHDDHTKVWYEHEQDCIQFILEWSDRMTIQRINA